jgi:dihydrofolate reductase
MATLRVHNLTISLDGYAAGPNQGLDAPLGQGAGELHGWMFATKSAGGTGVGTDDNFTRWGDENIGATIMGRNMFGPVRGEWPDETWRGWWGENPPFHHDVFVLTHHPRPDLRMEGGTTFHFVGDAPEVVLQRAFDAAGGRDVRLGGGAATVREYLSRELVEVMHVVVVPQFLGSGERLFGDLPLEAYEVVDTVTTSSATHVVVAKKA